MSRRGSVAAAPAATARTYTEMVDEMVDRMVNERRAQNTREGDDMDDDESGDVDMFRLRAARPASIASEPWDALARSYTSLEERLEAERALENARDPRSTPWQWAMV